VLVFSLRLQRQGALSVLRSARSGSYRKRSHSAAARAERTGPIVSHRASVFWLPGFVAHGIRSALSLAAANPATSASQEYQVFIFPVSPSSAGRFWFCLNIFRCSDCATWSPVFLVAQATDPASAPSLATRPPSVRPPLSARACRRHKI
jgi:hypothetical protein